MVVRSAQGKTKPRKGQRLPLKIKGALADYQRRVLELFPDDIQAIILYGSYARSEATPDSDVDLMVVVKWTDPQGVEAFYSARDERWDRLVDIASDILLEHGSFISVIAHNERLFNSNDPLSRDVKQTGIILWQREGWKMAEEEEKHPADLYNPQTWLEMAQPKFEKARKVFEMEMYDVTVSLAYYAMFYAARAALLTQGLYLKKHSAAQAKLQELLVNAGELEEKYVTYLGQGQADREKSDYEPFTPISREKAQETLQHAEEFITRVKKLVEEKKQA